MLEEKIPNFALKFKKSLVNAALVITGGITGGCGPNYIPATYTPPPTASASPTDIGSELATYFSESTGCNISLTPNIYRRNGVSIGNNTATCRELECVSRTTRPTPYCEDVHHPARHSKYGDSEAYTSRECGVRDATVCLEEDWVEKWRLFADKKCLGVTADYEVNDKDGRIGSAVIKVQYEDSTERVPYYGSDVRSFTDFINKHYCKR